MQLAGFNCLSEISRGPMTTLYLCRGKRKSVKFLVKILHPQYSEDDEISKRFSRESAVYAKLKHPNIVKVLDFGNQDGLHFIVMEYITGWPLDKFVKSFKPVPAEYAILMAFQMVQGVQYAHKQGIIHRDIKPSNILVSYDGQVKLTDFGLARQSDISAITEHGNIVGTPAYMAPELLTGQNATFGSDIFSMGVTWYELLSGENPFRGETIPESINNILNENPASLTKYDKNVPEWFDEMVIEMLSKDPTCRPFNCQILFKKMDKYVPKEQKENTVLRVADYLHLNHVHVVNHEMNISKTRNIITLKKSMSLLVLIFVLVIIYMGIFSNNVNNKNIDLEKPLVDSVLRENHIPESPLEKQIQKADTEFDKEESTEIQNFIPKSNIYNNDTLETIQFPGEIYLAVTPWADVYLNGNYYGTTPLIKNISLPPGNNQIELRNPAYKSFKSIIETNSEQIDTLKVRLEELYGDLMVTVLPWGKVFLNDKYIDTTPLEKPIRVQSGRYQLLIKNPYYAIYEESIEIEAGQIQQINVSLTK